MTKREAVPRAVLAERIGGFQGWMRGAGLERTVVFGLGSAAGPATRSHGNLRYLADWDGTAWPGALVIAPEGPPALATGEVYGAEFAIERGGFAEVRYAPLAELGATLLALLGDARRIGLAGRAEMPAAVWEVLAAAGARDWIDAEPELERRRAVKDAVQIAHHRQAAALCDRIFAALGPELRRGKPVWRVKAALEYLARDAGCEHCTTWLTVRPVADRCRFRAEEGPDPPAPGDQVVLGIMALDHGHWGHAIRMGSIGPPGEAAIAAHAAVRAAHGAMLAALRPGADLSDVHAAGERALALENGAWGGRAVRRFRSGHALGHSYEDPIGTSQFHQPYRPGAPAPALAIRPGMLFELHPNLFIEGLAGAAIGDMVLIGESGPELLTRHPREIEVF